MFTLIVDEGSGLVHVYFHGAVGADRSLLRALQIGFGITRCRRLRVMTQKVVTLLRELTVDLAKGALTFALHRERLTD